MYSYTNGAFGADVPEKERNMKKIFITFALFCFYSITFARNYTFAVGEPLVKSLDKSIFPGTWQFPRQEGVAVLSEVKLTEEGKGYFRLFATAPARELIYNIKIGDKFYIENRYSYFNILPYKGSETLAEDDNIWIVIDIQDNLITFEE